MASIPHVQPQRLGLATLVQLGHPIVAMRALRPAFEDKKVDPDTFTWLISQALTSNTTVGTARDLADAKEQAAALLRAFSGRGLLSAMTVSSAGLTHL